MDAGAFYGSLAGASAALYGIPVAFYASRLGSLTERAAGIRREIGDLLNEQGSNGVTTERDWKVRARNDEIADIYDIARDVQRSSTGLLVGSLTLVVGSLVPFLALQLEHLWYAVVLMAAFVSLGAWWLAAFRKSASGLLRHTEVQAALRKQRRTEATASGKGFLISGDPEALKENQLALVESLPQLSSTWRGKIAIYRWKRRVRREKPTTF